MEYCTTMKINLKESYYSKDKYYKPKNQKKKNQVKKRYIQPGTTYINLKNTVYVIVYLDQKFIHMK